MLLREPPTPRPGGGAESRQKVTPSAWVSSISPQGVRLPSPAATMVTVSPHCCQPCTSCTARQSPPEDGSAAW